MTTQACDQIAKPVRSPIGPRHQHPHHNTPNGFLLFPHNKDICNSQVRAQDGLSEHRSGLKRA